MSFPDYPWESDFYNPALFEAGAGDKDAIKTLEIYLEQIGTSPCRILDIGCGTGRFALQCIDVGHQVLGIDRSKDMLNTLAKKSALLPLQQQERLSFYQGDFLESPAHDQANYDFVVAMDDFTTHFCNLGELEKFFQVSRQWISDTGFILTDLRNRSPERLEKAATSEPKAIHTFGIASNVKSADGVHHVSMRFWEEYDEVERILLCHQIYDYIDSNGEVKKTAYRSIRQRNHSIEELTQAAELAGFYLENVSYHTGPTSKKGAEHHFFRFGTMK